MKYSFRFDPKKCVACGACAVACMDQNDIELSAGDEPFRSVRTVEALDSPEKKIRYISSGCMHCKSAPCIKACPKGCLWKNELGLTEYDNTACIDCRRCAAACPFNAPVFPRGKNKMEKCNGCQVRLEYGLEPACVRVCPTKALKCPPEE